ncbi:hypothetical protein I4U23_016850 [Adineta vaga]|nr:hypothetical protein I4U23_016850 [Adineta vaga]
MSSTDDNLLSRAWGYAIGGVIGVVIAIIGIVIAACRKHQKEKAIKDAQKAARNARSLALQQQTDSFSNVAYRADADIFTRVGMSPIQMNLPSSPHQSSV